MSAAFSFTVAAEACPDTATLRDLIIERDRAAIVLARLDAMILTMGRERWRAQGLRGTPTIGQVRKEVGV